MRGIRSIATTIILVGTVHTAAAADQSRSREAFFRCKDRNGQTHYELDCCSELRCIGALAGKACTKDADCGGAPKSCDACDLYGGVTTEDEMFILTGSYYHVPPP